MPFIAMPDRILVPEMVARDLDPTTWTVQPGTNDRLHSLVTGSSPHVDLPLAVQTAAAHVVNVPMASTGGGTTVKLRDYQLEAVDAVHDAWERGAKAPLLLMGCGGGKTICAAEIMGRVYEGSGGKSLFLAHREELLTQTMDKVRLVSPNTRVGLVQQKTNELGREITVASIQTVGHRSGTKLKALIENGPYKVVIADECFPAGTMIGNVPIELVRVGDMVPSYDETTGAWCERHVSAVMVNKAPTKLHSLTARTYKITATPNHPVMTRSGWTRIADVKEGDEVFCEIRTTVQGRMRTSAQVSTRPALLGMQSGDARYEAGAMGRPVCGVRCAADVEQEESERGAVEWSGLLFNRLLEGGSPQGRVGDDGAYEPKVRVSSHEVEQSDEAERQQRKDVADASENRTRADGSRGERQGSKPCREGTFGCAVGDQPGVGAGSRPPHLRIEGARVPDSLQDRYCTSGTQDLRGDRRWFARDAFAPGAGQEEGRLLAWTRVDRVEVLERAGADLDGKLRSDDPCRDGLVYNLEVDGTHTYLANGVVVHNCHHFVSPMNMRVLAALREANPETLLCGMTATPGRADGLALDRVFDVVAYEKNMFDLIRDGWLVPPHGFRVDIDIDLDKVETDDGDYVVTQLSKLMNTPHVNRAVVEAWRAYGHDRKCLVFACDVAHAHALAQEFNDAGHPAEALDGKTKKKERKEVLGRFREGAIKLLVSCQVITEGYDDPSAEGIVFARPTQSQSLFAQMLGRGLRLFPGKTEAIIIDCVGNSAKHRPVQLASLAGLDPQRQYRGGLKGFGEEKDVEPVEENEVTGAKVGEATEVKFHVGKPRGNYQWRETTLGWILQIPRIGYYLVAWSDRAKHMATIRFFDQRAGRKHEPPREIVRQPVEFDMAYGLVESEMDRIFRARSMRRDDKAPKDDDQPVASFVDLDEGTDEAVVLPEEELMLKDAAWRDNATSPKQQQLLVSLGVKEKTMPGTSGEASDLITIMRVERDMKMRVPATVKQINYLRYHKLPVVENLTKGMAARAIWTHRKATGS